MLKNQRGITLVALVVTIVVLIILATISISVAMNGGILGQAQRASDAQANAEKQYDHVANQTVEKVNQYFLNAESR